MSDEMSNVSINGERLTWQQLAKHYRDDLYEMSKWRQLCMDLDRCEHGRHEGDDCFGCDGPSHGNICGVSDQIGYGLAGETAIVIPSREERHDPDKWRVTL